jgi:four helix bundle protein
MVKTHKDLDVWKRSIELVKGIYKITEKFPDTEKFILAAQLKRTAISIPSNIAEGAARFSTKEFIQFLYFSLGSLSELETQLIIASGLGYEVGNQLEIEVVEIRKQLLNLIRSLKGK